MPRTPVQALAFVLGFWIALLLSPFGARGARADAATPPHAEIESGLHADVNALRERRNLTRLARDPALDAVARAHSADMARRSYLSHVNPEGQNPVDRLHAAGIDGFSLAAENAGLTSRGEPRQEILHGWLDSPVHRRNLQAPPWNRTGIGIARAPDGTWYVTQLYVTVPR